MANGKKERTKKVPWAGQAAGSGPVCPYKHVTPIPPEGKGRQDRCSCRIFSLTGQILGIGMVMVLCCVLCPQPLGFPSGH